MSDFHVKFVDAFQAAQNEERGADEENPPSIDESNDLPVITLDNLEEPWTKNSRYVLTSPRSLEACNKYAIKPVDLLRKTMEDFYEEFPNVNRNVLRGMYEREERERQRRLRLVRTERDGLVEHEKSRKPKSDEFLEDPDFMVKGSALEVATEHHEPVEEFDYRTEDDSDDDEFKTKPVGFKIEGRKSDADALSELKNRYQQELQRLTQSDSKVGGFKKKAVRISSAPVFSRSQQWKFSASSSEKEETECDNSLHVEAIERIRQREAAKRRDLKEKKLREQERKKQQEMRKKALEKEREHAIQCMKSDLDKRSQTAVMTKAELERSEQLKRIVENAERELKHIHNKKSVEQQLYNSLDVKKSYLEQKHDLAKERHLQAQMKKEAEIRKKVRADTVKAELVRRSMQQKEEEMQLWREMTAKKLAEDEERAVKVNENVKKRKQQKIHADLTIKQQNYISTKRKIEQQNQKLRKLLESEINAKDARSRVLKEERNLTAQKRRELASLTRQTEELGLSNSRNDFHEKALQAEITNNILFNYRKMAFPSGH